ncbi:MAG: ferritin family protein [Pseudomonadota bacterium]
MDQFKSVDDILDFAIEREQESTDFYNQLAGQVEKPWMKDLFRGFSQEEMKHKAKLQSVKSGQTLLPSKQKVLDLKIADYLVDVEASPGMNFQEALMVAMKKEKAAFKLYTDLAKSTNNNDLQSSFQALAQEEAKHKLHFEVLYDDLILSDN